MMLFPTPSSGALKNLLAGSTDVAGGDAAEALSAALAGHTFSDGVLAMAAQIQLMAETMAESKPELKFQALRELVGLVAYCALADTGGADNDA